MKFNTGLIILLAAAAAGMHVAESLPRLTCNSRQFSNGSVEFQLSQAPSSSSCTTCWEDRNKTVVARGEQFVPEVVLSLRDDSITLADCRDLRYSLECNGVLQEIDCPVNCSHHEDQDPPSHPSNSTAPHKPTIIIIIVIVIAAAAALMLTSAMLWWRPEAESPFGLWRTIDRLREVP